MQVLISICKMRGMRKKLALNPAGISCSCIAKAEILGSFSFGRGLVLQGNSSGGKYLAWSLKLGKRGRPGSSVFVNGKCGATSRVLSLSTLSWWSNWNLATQTPVNLTKYVPNHTPSVPGFLHQERTDFKTCSSHNFKNFHYSSQKSLQISQPYHMYKYALRGRQNCCSWWMLVCSKLIYHYYPMQSQLSLT